MTVKSLRKQLFLGIVTLLIAVFSITGATYAWFSMNNTVSASGIEIKANAEGLNFEITSTVDSDNHPVFTAGQTTDSKTFAATNMLPTHPDIESGGLKWQHAVSQVYDDAAITAARNDLSLSHNVVKDSSNIYQYEILYDANGNYVLHTTYYLRLNSDTTADGATLNNIIANNVVLTGADASNDYAKCTRLVVKGPEGAYEIGPSGSTGEGSAASSGTLIAQITKGNEYQVDVYAFFEGMDENCKSSIFLPTSLGISVDFTEGPANP